jgi:hypothetical protein
MLAGCFAAFPQVAFAARPEQATRWGNVDARIAGLEHATARGPLAQRQHGRSCQPCCFFPGGGLDSGSCEVDNHTPSNRLGLAGPAALWLGAHPVLNFDPCE